MPDNNSHSVNFNYIDPSNCKKCNRFFRKRKDENFRKNFEVLLLVLQSLWCLVCQLNVSELPEFFFENGRENLVLCSQPIQFLLQLLLGL